MSQLMDWIGLLRHQQQDFISRLKTGHLISSSMPGCHSESVVISGERLKVLRGFCWEMAEKYKRGSKVKNTFINNLKGKLGEEIVKRCLGDFVTEVDYQLKLGGDGKIDFMLSSDLSKGIQVKTRTFKKGSEITWMVNLDEIQKNEAIVCILVEEEIDEAQAEYHLFFAGFIPSILITDQQKINHIKIDDLLYSSGLKWFLENTDSVKFLTEQIQETPALETLLTDNKIIPFGIGPVELFPGKNEILFQEQGLKLVLSSIVLPGEDSLPFQKTNKIDALSISATSLEVIGNASFLDSKEKESLIENTRFLFQTRILELIQTDVSQPSSKKLIYRIAASESRHLSIIFNSLGSTEKTIFFPKNKKIGRIIDDIKNIIAADTYGFYQCSFYDPLKFVEAQKIDIPSSGDHSIFLEELFFHSINRTTDELERISIWESVVNILLPLGTKALFSQQGRLLAIDQDRGIAFVEVQSKPLMKMAVGRIDNLANAFKTAMGRKITTILVTLHPL